MMRLPNYVFASEETPNTFTLLKKYSSVPHGSQSSLSYRIFSKVLVLLLVALTITTLITIFSPLSSELKICSLYVGIALGICILLAIAVYCILNKILSSCIKPLNTKSQAGIV
ncbi:hypothetical protein C10C_0397 [Chlamydia serpentis]|uniref:Uncharacterized protein n=1 Tax=Chlamydia serpentis TaxID=1967782 RepID=A0A2R8FB98_9CHLA|nr:hypothetical protein [Chlamydia serpentis]SPN73566.1 hypothetical protein C10C_0397 [Chlamydia serpentis]